MLPCKTTCKDVHKNTSAIRQKTNFQKDSTLHFLVQTGLQWMISCKWSSVTFTLKLKCTYCVTCQRRVGRGCLWTTSGVHCVTITKEKYNNNIKLKCRLGFIRRPELHHSIYWMHIHEQEHSPTFHNCRVFMLKTKTWHANDRWCSTHICNTSGRLMNESPSLRPSNFYADNHVGLLLCCTWDLLEPLAPGAPVPTGITDVFTPIIAWYFSSFTFFLRMWSLGDAASISHFPSSVYHHIVWLSVYHHIVWLKVNSNKTEDVKPKKVYKTLRGVKSSTNNALFINTL